MGTFTIFLILIVVVSFLLVAVIMVQNPKGGGLSSTFGGGGGSSIGGVQSTNNFLDRTTWTLAIAMFALILLANFAIPRDGANNVNIDGKLNQVNSAPNTTNTVVPPANTGGDSLPQ